MAVAGRRLQQAFELLSQVLVHLRRNLQRIAFLHLFDQTIQPRTLQVGVEALAGGDRELAVVSWRSSKADSDIPCRNPLME